MINFEPFRTSNGQIDLVGVYRFLVDSRSSHYYWEVADALDKVQAIYPISSRQAAATAIGLAMATFGKASS